MGNTAIPKGGEGREPSARADGPFFRFQKGRDAVPDAIETLECDQFDLRYAELRLKRPELLEAMRGSIERHGLLQPLVVNVTRDGAKVLLDGFKRLQAVRLLGWTQVSIRVLRLDEAAARAAILTHNVTQQGLCELEEAWIIHSLVRTCALTQSAVAELVGRHKSWVCRRLQLAERLDQPLQDDMRLGLLRATTARELARLPRGNQGGVAEAVRQHGLTTRQTARLVDKVVMAASPESIDPLLADPLRFVQPEAAPTTAKDPRLSAKAEAIRQSLLRLSQGAAAVCHQLSRHPPMSLHDLDAEILAEIASPVIARAEDALTLSRHLVRHPPQ